MSGLERDSFGRCYWSVWSLLQDCVVFVWKNRELDVCNLVPLSCNLIPRVLKLFGQRVVTRALGSRLADVCS